MPDSFDGAHTGARKPRVLVADDDLVMRSFLRLVLATQYDVVEASDGRDAIDALDADGEFACVVCDDRMPRATGLDVAAHVRDTPRLHGVPVLLITAKETSSAARQVESRAAGAVAFLHKPFTRAQLTTLVGTLVNQRNARRSA